MRIDRVGDEVVENGVGRQRTVLADFLREFAGFVGQRFHAFGELRVLLLQLRLFLALNLHLLLRRAAISMAWRRSRSAI